MSLTRYFLGIRFHPNATGHISKFKDGNVCLVAKSRNGNSNCYVHKADDLVKTIMTTSLCIDNPSRYRKFNFKGLEGYFSGF